MSNGPTSSKQSKLRYRIPIPTLIHQFKRLFLLDSRLLQINTSITYKRMSGTDSLAYFTGNGTYRAINPLVSHVGDFTKFYIAIAISSVILGSLIILNVVCCCSRYSDYWLDRHTGNRWLVSIWSATPHKQPPLDLTELESQYRTVQYVQQYVSEYHEAEVPPSVSQQPLTSSQEYLELHKRESDI